MVNHQGAKSMKTIANQLYGVNGNKAMMYPYFLLASRYTKKEGYRQLACFPAYLNRDWPSPSLQLVNQVLNGEPS